jgi:hypothetical protein
MRTAKIKTTLYRAVLHTPLGALAAYLGGTPAVLIVVLFLAYEITEDWRIHDHAFIDIKSFMVGYIGVLLGTEVIF